MKKRIFKDIYAKFADSADRLGPVFDGDKTVYSHKELDPLEGTVEWKTKYSTLMGLSFFSLQLLTMLIFVILVCGFFFLGQCG
jgi:hypothetical protein